jgi:pSer/pThr/pTyr-binding forkhead associated (FHA) protein
VAGEDKPVKAVISWTLGGDQELLLREGDTVEIGREKGLAMSLPDEFISRKHAVITWHNNHFSIQDLGSSNGTLVNGQLINKLTVLKDGDRLLFHQIQAKFTEYKAPQPVAKKEGVLQTVVVLPSTPRPNLEISSGPGEGRKIILKKGEMVIGRATSTLKEWEIALQDRSISRPQARIENNETGVSLTDLESANGTLLNGQPLEMTTLLKDGDVIVFGETTLIFRTS